LVGLVVVVFLLAQIFNFLIGFLRK
jgi:hypothetical protein